jgi:catechol 2,3-dioxygenase-like lactoylglutathione lyase family enzyme
VRDGWWNFLSPVTHKLSRTLCYVKLDGLIAFYPCHDLEATRNFYERDLCLPLVRDQGTCLIFKVAREAYIGFCQHTDDVPEHKGLIVTLLTNDVEGVYQRLRQLNIETEAAPKLNETYQIYHFFARDPDGYRVEIQRFLEPL